MGEKGKGQEQGEEKKEGEKMKHLGDITKIHGASVEPVEVIRQHKASVKNAG